MKQLFQGYFNFCNIGVASCYDFSMLRHLKRGKRKGISWTIWNVFFHGEKKFKSWICAGWNLIFPLLTNNATCKGLFYGAIGQPKNFEVNRLLYEKTPAFSLPLTEAYALIMNRRYKGKKDRLWPATHLFTQWSLSWKWKDCHLGFTYIVDF